MRRLFALLLSAFLLAPGQAQVPSAIGLAGSHGAEPSYTGPGDIVASATAWWGLRAYSSVKRGGKSINVCNVADVVCADLSTDPITGKLVIGLIGGSSCSVVTCTVKTIYDQTGNGNDLTEATIASRPTLVVSCVSSLPCLAFASGQQLLRANFNSSTDLVQPFSVSAAYKDTGTSTGTAGAIVQATDGSANPCALWTNDGATARIELYCQAPTLRVNGVTANTWHSAQGIYNGASSNLNVDGTDNTGTTGTHNFYHNSVTIGQDALDPTFIGNIVEVGVWPSGFSSGNASAVSSNQHTFWGF